MDIDYAVAWHFLDASGRRLQLRFRPNATSPDGPGCFDARGQLIAVDDRGDNSCDEVAISRPNVLRADVDAAIDGWEDWATLIVYGISRWISLDHIRCRIDSAGLGLSDGPMADRAKEFGLTHRRKGAKAGKSVDRIFHSHTRPVAR